MSGVGGVGGGGGGAGGGGAPAAGGVGGAGGADAVAPAAGASDSGDFSGGNGAVKPAGEDGGTGAHVPPMGCNHGQMNTQNFIQMHNSSVQQVNESQSPEMDLKKLIEMMMAIKLLQEMNKS